MEEEFVNAIRGREKIARTTFEDGVRYMEFTDAVTRSATTGQTVDDLIELTSGVKAGDKVSFHVEKINGALTVTKIEVPK